MDGNANKAVRQDPKLSRLTNSKSPRLSGGFCSEVFHPEMAQYSLGHLRGKPSTPRGHGFRLHELARPASLLACRTVPPRGGYGATRPKAARGWLATVKLPLIMTAGFTAGLARLFTTAAVPLITGLAILAIAP